MTDHDDSIAADFPAFTATRGGLRFPQPPDYDPAQCRWGRCGIRPGQHDPGDHPEPGVRHIFTVPPDLQPAAGHYTGGALVASGGWIAAPDAAWDLFRIRRAWEYPDRPFGSRYDTEDGPDFDALVTPRLTAALRALTVARRRTSQALAVLRGTHYIVPRDEDLDDAD